MNMCEHVEDSQSQVLNTKQLDKRLKLMTMDLTRLLIFRTTKRTAKNTDITTTTGHRSTVQYKLNTVSLVKQLLANKH